MSEGKKARVFKFTKTRNGEAIFGFSVFADALDPGESITLQEVLPEQESELAEKMKKLWRVAWLYNAGLGGGWAGQALTEYTCLRCDQKQMHSNTAVPIMCKPCADLIRNEMKAAMEEKK